MKNFDDKRRIRLEADRQFTIGGETFTQKTGLRPEVLLPWENIGADTPASEVLATIDQLVHDFIEPADDAHARWDALRKRDDDPVTLQDLQELVEWLIEEQTGRPTSPPSASTPSAPTQPTGSTEGSSSPPAEASTD